MGENYTVAQTPAPTTSASSSNKKVYYVLKRNVMYCNSMFHNGLDRYVRSVGQAKQFNTVSQAIDFLRSAHQNSIWCGDVCEIVRVEETPGSPSRRVATCSEKPTGYVIQDGMSYFADVKAGIRQGWTSELSRAQVFVSEKDAIRGLTERAMRLQSTYYSTIVRIIDVPATLVITETVLS